MANKYDIIIVGAGIAGLSAAVYAARAGKKTLILEKNIEGGLILSTPDVENYPGFLSISGYELIQKIKEQAKAAGAETVYDNAVAFDFSGRTKLVKTLSGEYEAGAVILALGSSNKKLGLKNEQELVGSGVSYCATCDGAFFRDMTVMVAGSGKGALSDAEYLAPLAKKVYIVSQTAVSNVEHANVEKLENAQVVELIGSPLEAVKVMREGKESLIKTDGLFISIGRLPASHVVKGHVKLDETGYILTDETMQTDVDGVFAVGDVRKTPLRQLVTAAADGAIAATNAIKYLRRI